MAASNVINLFSREVSGELVARMLLKDPSSSLDLSMLEEFLEGATGEGSYMVSTGVFHVKSLQTRAVENNLTHDEYIDCIVGFFLGFRNREVVEMARKIRSLKKEMHG